MMWTLCLLLVAIFSAQAQMLFDGTRQQHVSHGYFYQPYDGTPNTYLANEFTVDAWIKIDPSLRLGYVISTGYGGGHAILLGVQGGGKHYAITGNIFSRQASGGLGLITFGSGGVLTADVWHMISVELKNNVITTFVDGVPQSQTPFSGQRIAATEQDDPGGGELFIGGSDHLNFTGMIGQVRIFEGYGIYAGHGFVPDISFRNQKAIGDTSTVVKSSFLADYAKCGSTIADESDGYTGARHPGAFYSAAFGLVGQRYNSLPLPKCVMDRTYPTRREDDLARPLPESPQPPPAGVAVFDSFSRYDTTIVGIPSIGKTELGQRSWSGYPFVVQANQAHPAGADWFATAFVDGYRTAR
ncbi:MAG TPA: LamG domain-containing protein [Pyrinomonadaceae bacterium]|jgi:hypothetical protein|nr:LamG domain-containing protein [Pyrinomonadaceae bacterium]